MCSIGYTEALSHNKVVAWVALIGACHGNSLGNCVAGATPFLEGQTTGVDRNFDTGGSKSSVKVRN